MMDFTLHDVWAESIDPIYMDPYYGEAAALDIIMEANDPTSGKSIGERIGTALKRIFEWLIKQVRATIQRWTRAIQTKLRIRDPDTILEDIGVKPNEDTSPDPINVPIAIEFMKPSENQELTKTIKLQSRPVRAHQDPNDPKRFIVKLSELEKGDSNKSTPVHAGCSSTVAGVQMALWIIINKDNAQQRLGDLIKTMDQKGFIKLWKNGGETLVKQVYAAKDPMTQFDPNGPKAPDGMTSDQVVFTLDQMTSFQNWLLEMNQYVSKIDAADMKKSAKVTMKNSEIKNEIVGLMTRLQFGVNWLMGEIGGHHIVSKGYFEAIDSFEEMSNFAEAMIKQGIASKYIMYNIVSTASKKLKSGMKSKCGQSRVVLFPQDQNVALKFALNGEGLRANANEQRMSQLNGMTSYLAPVKQMSKNSAGLVMDRCKMIPASEQFNWSNQKNADAIRDGINKRLEEQHIPMRVTDVHAGNVGYLNGTLVCYDYGDCKREANAL